MNRGALDGFSNVRGEYPPLPVGGSWAGNRGRVSTDELRLWGYPNDGGKQGSGQCGAAKVVNTNALQGVKTIIYPGDTGSVVNVLSGIVQLNGVGGPFNAMYNTAGEIQCGTNSTNTTSCYECNTVVTNVGGLAVSLLSIQSFVGGTTYVATGAACSMGTTETVCVGSGDAFTVLNSGTLSVTTHDGFLAQCAADAGVTITTRNGLVVKNFNGSGATVTNQYGINLPIFVGAGTVNTGIVIGPVVTGGGVTLTAASSPQIDLWQGTVANPITLNYANCSIPAMLNFSGTIAMSQAGLVSTLFNWSPVIKNTAADAVGMATVTFFQANPTFQADTATVANAGGHTIFNAAPKTNVINSGVITTVSFTNYKSGANIGASTTCSSLVHYQVNAPTLTGTLTSQVGLAIPVLSGAGTNVGIQCATNSVFGAGAGAGSSSWAIRIQGGNNASAALEIDTSSTAPAVPASTAGCAVSVYFGGTNYYFMLTYNDGGTTRYKYVVLDGTGVTWTEATTLPT